MQKIWAYEEACVGSYLHPCTFLHAESHSILAALGFVNVRNVVGDRLLLSITAREHSFCHYLQITGGRAKTEHLYAVSSTNLGVKYCSRTKYSLISLYRGSWTTRQWFKILHDVKFLLPTRWAPIWASQSLQVQPIIDYSLASAGHLIQAHDNPNTHRRKKIVALKFGSKFLEMGIREIRTSLQDDAKEGYKLTGIRFRNLARRFSHWRVQLTL